MPRSADLRGVDDDVAQVVAGGGVEGPVAGDEAQFRIGGGAVYRLGREVILDVGLDGGHAELDQRPVGSLDVDLVAVTQIGQPVEHRGTVGRVEVPDDDGRTDGTRPRAARV